MFSAICVVSTLAVIKFSFVCGSSATEKKLFELSVVHYNDFHARFEETNIVSGKCTNTECIGGFARLRYQILKMKNENPDILLLDAGDNSQETIFYIIGKWNITQQFFNTLPIDAAVLGNHDFDYHIEGVVPFLKAVKYPIVVSNIDSSLEPSMNGLYNKSIVIERHGKKIGIIGVITSLTPFVSNTGKLKFLPESPSINEEAERLVREEGVFTNIVLSHAGYDVDQQIAENSSSKISLIVGGHSHVFLYTGDNPPGPYIVEGPYPTIVQNKKGENVLIVQAAAYTKFLGNITAFLDEHGRVTDYSGEPIFLNTTIPKDDTVTKNLISWKAVVDTRAEIPVGSSLVPLTNRGCFYKECTLGNFVTDAMVFYFTDMATKEEWTYAPMAIINPGSLRTDLQKGNLTFADIVMAQPFANLVQAGEIEGRYIKDLFESTVKAFEPKLVHAGLKLLQVSGIKVVYNLTKPVDQRVESIKVRCLQCSVIEYEPLYYNKTYRIVGNSFLAKGGDSYFVFANHFRPMFDGLVDVEVLQKYFKYRSPVFVEEEGRIIVYGASAIRERKSNRLKYENYSR